MYNFFFSRVAIFLYKIIGKHLFLRRNIVHLQVSTMLNIHPPVLFTELHSGVLRILIFSVTFNQFSNNTILQTLDCWLIYF